MAVVRFEWSPARRVLVTFGVSLAATGLLVAGVLLWQALPVAAAVVVGATAALGGLVALAPGTAAARLVYRAVSLPAFAIGNVVSVALLTLFFFLVVTPIGLVRRARGADPLGLRGSGSTDWTDVSERPPDDPERLF